MIADPLNKCPFKRATILDKPEHNWSPFSMRSKTKRPMPNKSQKAAFIETARKLSCDESEPGFEKKIGKIAKAKTKQNLKKR